MNVLEAAGERPLLPWPVVLVLAASLHAGAILLFVGKPRPVPTAPEGLEAVVMIDLPPEPSVPPAESVESVAVPERTGAEKSAAPAAEPVEMPPPVDRAPEQPDGEIGETASIAPPEPETVPAPHPVDSGPKPDAAAPLPTETAPTAPIAVPEPMNAAEQARTESPAPMRAEAAATDRPVPAVPPRVPTLQPKRIEAAEPAPKKPRKPTRPPASRQQPATAASAGREVGKAGSGAGRSDPDALSRYLSSVRADIMRQRRSLRAHGRGRQAVVRFRIETSGEIVDLVVVRSSGKPEFDDAALALVRRASPVPPIPPDVGRSALQTTLPIRFD